MPLSSTKLLRISKLNSIFYEWTKKFYKKKNSQNSSTPTTPNPKHKIHKKKISSKFIRDKAIGSSKTRGLNGNENENEINWCKVAFEWKSSNEKKKGGKEKKKNDATKGRLNGIPRGEALILLLSRF